MGEWERKNMINELMKGKELAHKLRMHLQNDPPSNAWERLLFRILLSFDKALAMLNWEKATTSDNGGSRLFGTSSSPTAPGESPMNLGNEGKNNNNDSDRNSGNNRNPRKATQRWTKRVKVTHGNGIQGQIDDGHSWRKYGQKDILGAKYPRGYYRCTHRDSEGCLATKQVQRSNEDPTVFEITNIGMHTCNLPSPSMPENEGPNVTSVVAASPPQQQQHQYQQADLETQKDHDELLEFYKSLATITCISGKNPLTAFSLPSISDDLHQSLHPFGTFNFPERVTRFDSFCESQDFHSQDDSEFGRVISAENGVATGSGTNSRAANARDSLDYIFDPPEFDNSFGNPGCF